MSHSVQMPALGESVTEGTVTRWLKKEGDTVAEDEPLLEVSTDKVDTEVPAPYSGVLEKILVQEDETVDIGTDLAIIVDGSGTAPADAGSAQNAPAAVPEMTQEATPAPAPSLSAQPAPDEGAPAAAAPAQSASPGSGSAGNGTTVTMPEMGESVTEGTITRWIKNIGDDVAEDEPIVEIATDKVDAEVPSPVAGTLLQIIAAEDDTVEVGSPIAVIGEAGSGSAPASTPAAPAPQPAAQATQPPAAQTTQPPAAQTPQPPAAVPPQQATPAPAPAAAAASAAGGAGHSGYVTPVVRKLAADHGVDLATIAGTGVGGRIRREDVLAAAAGAAGASGASAAAAATAPAPAAVAASQATPAFAPAAPSAAPSPAPQPVPSASAVPQSASPGRFGAALAGTTQPAPRIRQAMARSMMHAVSSSAQTTTIIEVDASRIAALRNNVRDVFVGREGIELTLTPFFVKAAIEAAKSHPIINASLSDDLASITYHAAVHLGIAVDTDRGQVVPVIHRADDLNVTGLARHLADLVDRTLRGALAPDELSGATLSITDTAAPGALIDTPIVVPPQAAVLALGAVTKRPVVVSDTDGNDVIAVRSIATMALSYDQRFVDGSDAGQYLSTLKQRIEGGDFLADLGL